MHIATLETRHFSFVALGASERLAREALRLGWQEHRRHYPEAAPWKEFADDVGVAEINLGWCLCDGDRIS